LRLRVFSARFNFLKYIRTSDLRAFTYRCDVGSRSFRTPLDIAPPFPVRSVPGRSWPFRSGPSASRSNRSRFVGCWDGDVEGRLWRRAPRPEPSVSQDVRWSVGVSDTSSRVPRSASGYEGRGTYATIALAIHVPETPRLSRIPASEASPNPHVGFHLVRLCRAGPSGGWLFRWTADVLRPFRGKASPRGVSEAALPRTRPQRVSKQGVRGFFGGSFLRVQGMPSPRSPPRNKLGPSRRGRGVKNSEIFASVPFFP